MGTHKYVIKRLPPHSSFNKRVWMLMNHQAHELVGDEVNANGFFYRRVCKRSSLAVSVLTEAKSLSRACVWSAGGRKDGRSSMCKSETASVSEESPGVFALWPPTASPPFWMNLSTAAL